MNTDLLEVGKLYEMKNPRRVKKEVPVFASFNDVKFFQEKTIVMLVEKKYIWVLIQKIMSRFFWMIKLI